MCDAPPKETRMALTIYHNPRCSKSRQTLELIEKSGAEAKVIEYLQNPPSAPELKLILKKLGRPAREIIRTGEEAYARLGLKNEALTEDELIEALVQNPILIERPIVVSADQAIIGRPPENVLPLL